MPVEVEDLVGRAQIALGMAVALEAPAHLQGRGPGDPDHLGHPAVAVLAGHALLHVDAVVEIDVVRQVVDAGPAQRRAGGQALAHRRQHVRIGPELGVAGHAGVGRRIARRSGGLDRIVAVAAVDSELADMMAVAERHRLHRREVSPGHVVRAHPAAGDQHSATGAQCQADQHQSQIGVGGPGEDLRHCEDCARLRHPTHSRRSNEGATVQRGVALLVPAEARAEPAANIKNWQCDATNPRRGRCAPVRPARPRSLCPCRSAPPVNRGGGE